MTRVSLLLALIISGATCPALGESASGPDVVTADSFSSALDKGNAFREKDKHEEALILFKKAVKLAENGRDASAAQFRVGLSLAALKRLDEAYDAFVELTRIKEPNPTYLYRAHMEMGWNLLRKGPGASLPMFEKALQLAPDGAARGHAMENIGWRMLEMKKRDAALAQWEKVARMEDAGAAARARSCQAYSWNSENPLKTIEMMEIAVAVDGLSPADTVQCWFVIAHKYQQMKRFRDAKDTLERFSKSNDIRPGDKERVAKVLAEIEVLLAK